MKAFDPGSLYSASDLLGFLGCQHKTFLDFGALQTPLVTAQEDAQAQLFQEKGKEHELHYLQHLRNTGLHVVEIPEERRLHDRVAQTLDAMRQGLMLSIKPRSCMHPGTDLRIFCNAWTAPPPQRRSAMKPSIRSWPISPHQSMSCNSASIQTCWRTTRASGPLPCTLC